MENADIKKEIAGINDKLTEIVYAIRGSGMTGDGGMVKKIDRIEIRQDTMDKEIKAWKEVISKELITIKNRNIKFDTYQSIFWSVIGSLLTMLTGYIITLIVK